MPLKVNGDLAGSGGMGEVELEVGQYVEMGMSVDDH